MRQKFYQKASVQVAIVSAIGLTVATLITIVHQRSQLKAENSELKRETANKTAEIQRLETLLAPFRTIALAKFTGPENESLLKLAQQIQSLQESDTQKSDKIRLLQNELTVIQQNALPRRLSVEKADKIKGILKTKPKAFVYIVSRWLDGESQAYANDFKKVLMEAGWSVQHTINYIDDSNNMVGVSVSVYLSDDTVAGQEDLKKALSDAGIPLTETNVGKDKCTGPSSGTLLLVVGRKQ